MSQTSLQRPVTLAKPETVNEIRNYLEKDVKLNLGKANNMTTIDELQTLMLEQLRSVVPLLEAQKSQTSQPLSGMDRSKEGIQKLLIELRQQQEVVSSLCFKICFIGAVKAGKSTIVNALIGQIMAPTDNMPCTVVPTILRNEQKRTTDLDKAELQLSGKFLDVMQACSKELLDCVSDAGFAAELECTLAVNEDLLKFYKHFKQSSGELHIPQVQVLHDKQIITSALYRFNHLFRLCGITRRELIKYKRSLNQKAAVETVLSSMRDIARLSTNDFPVVVVPFALNDVATGPSAGTLEIVDTPGRDELAVVEEIAAILHNVISESQCVVVVNDLTRLGTDSYKEVQDAMRAAKTARTPVFVLGNKFDVVQQGGASRDAKMKQFERSLARDFLQNPRYAEGSIKTFQKRVSCVAGYKAYLYFFMKKQIDNMGGEAEMSKRIQNAEKNHGRTLLPDEQEWLRLHNLHGEQWDRPERVEYVSRVSEIKANQKALKGEGNFKDFQDLILDFLQKNVCFTILLEAAKDVDKVVGDIAEDMHMLLGKQCKTSDTFEEERQSVMKELGNLSGYKEEWKRALKECKEKTLGEVKATIQNTKAALSRKAGDVFEDYEDKKEIAWKREFKVTEKNGNYYYRTRDLRNADDIINDLIKHLALVYHEELQTLMGSCVETSLTNLNKAVASIRQTNEQIPENVKKILRFNPPELGSVRKALTDKLTITKLEEEAAKRQLAAKKKPGFTARLMATMSLGYKKAHNEYQIYPSKLIQTMSLLSEETLRNISPSIDSTISAECEKLLSGMMQGIGRREMEVLDVFNRAQKPMSDEELRQAFEFYKPYSVVHGNIQSIKVKCEEKNLEVKAKTHLGAFDPALWPKEKTRLEAFKSADPDMKRSMLLQLAELPRTSFTTTDASDAATVLANALGEGDPELRTSAAQAIEEMLEGRNMHKDVLATMVQALVIAMRDFNDTEIARMLGKLLRDEATTFNTIRELILQSFSSVLDSAVFTNDNLVRSLEVMLDRDLKSQLTGIAKDAAKNIVIGYLEKQIGETATKSAAKAAEAIAKSGGGSCFFGLCCPQAQNEDEPYEEINSIV
eukprot:TRINITY_DN30905_c0_g1_i1.p1 TRINITY_DN30905_c0_g1~~TRINITY_DN30905_c0_g1_i1.p1  ORF type:complete len:1084 (+),score=212.01 TRINITY_DN30905_c0_g1_i1:115-3366(+)